MTHGPTGRCQQQIKLVPWPRGGHAVAQLVEAPRYKRIRFPKVSLEFFIDLILQATLGSIQPVTEMITSNMSWG